MKLIKPNVEYIPQAEGLEGAYKQIELSGRTCYFSNDKITEDSAKEFVDRMIKSGHGAMLEHGTVYLFINWMETDLIQKYKNNNYSFCTDGDGLRKAITTNYRAIMQGGYDTYEEAIANNFDKNWLDDLQYICEPTEHHEKRVTFNFEAISIGTSREFLRHRVFSFAQQSTRYCNYSKSDKFGNDLTFIIPSYYDIPEGIYDTMYEEGFYVWGCNGQYLNTQTENESLELFLSVLDKSEIMYKRMINDYKLKPQEAREVLPLALNAPLIMTGFVSDWKHFLSLRTHKSAHPDAVILAKQVENKLKELELIK